MFGFLTLAILAAAVAYRYVYRDSPLNIAAQARVALWGVGLGALGFVLGFFGPILLAPDANQGPLLGIFITGPLGLVGGLVWGLWREHGRRARPRG